MDRAKPFCIAKEEVWAAYKQVKANHGAAGVDGESIEAFETDLGNNFRAPDMPDGLRRLIEIT